MLKLATEQIPTGRDSKNKKKPDASHWTVEGEVQLLSIAERAEEEIDKSKSESAQPETNKSATAGGETAEGGESKEDDKRVVTVATFGFPEVAIQPPPVASSATSSVGASCDGEKGDASDVGDSKDKETEEGKKNEIASTNGTEKKDEAETVASEPAVNDTCLSTEKVQGLSLIAKWNLVQTIL